MGESDRDCCQSTLKIKGSSNQQFQPRRALLPLRCDSSNIFMIEYEKSNISVDFHDSKDRYIKSRS
jgi:hypothetical protein